MISGIGMPISHRQYPGHGSLLASRHLRKNCLIDNPVPFPCCLEYKFWLNCLARSDKRLAHSSMEAPARLKRGKLL